MKIKTIIIAMILVTGLGWGEEDNREEYLKKYPVAKNAVKLKHLYSFPNDNDEQDVYLKRARKLKIIGDTVVITDSYRNKIFMFTLKGEFIRSFGSRGKGPGELLNVISVDQDNLGRLVVQDDANRRIQYFDMEGRYLDSFKVFSTSQDLAVDKKGNIYLTPLQIYSDKKTIIQVLNPFGISLREFGTHKFGKDKSFTFLSLDKEHDQIAVAWIYFPKVKVFSTNGDLLADIHIKHKLIEENQQKNQKAQFKNRRIDLHKAINAFAYQNKQLFLLKTFPRILILKMNLKAEIENEYWYDFKAAFNAMDLAVLEKQNEYLFFILQILPENQVIVFSAPK